MERSIGPAKWKLWTAAVFAAGLLLAAVSAAGLPKQTERASPWGESYLPNSLVVDQHGASHRFYDDLFKDQVVVVSFFYTSCKSVCPLVVARLKDVADGLAQRKNQSIRFVTITIDPIPDTPERLNRYAKAFGIDGNWHFVSGETEVIDEIRHKLGERTGRAIEQHRNEVLIYNDRTARWVRDSAFSDISALTHTIEKTAGLPADVGFTAVPVAIAPSDVHNHPGQALFAKACATCHTIGAGQKIGPDLLPLVTDNRLDWAKRYMRNPQAMAAAGDDTALALRRAYPDIRMPTLGLSEDDADDIAAYLSAKAAVAKRVDGGAP